MGQERSYFHLNWTSASDLRLLSRIRFVFYKLIKSFLFGLDGLSTWACLWGFMGLTPNELYTVTKKLINYRNISPNSMETPEIQDLNFFRLRPCLNRLLKGALNKFPEWMHEWMRSDSVTGQDLEFRLMSRYMYISVKGEHIWGCATICMHKPTIKYMYV